MKKIIFLIFILTFDANAEIVTAIGKHKHLGDKTKIQSCKIAEEKAKKNAIVKSLGQNISTDVVTNCSEVDGEYNCERNQFSLFELRGDITGYKIINKKYENEIGSEILFCEIEIEANVEPAKINQDPTFHFNVSLDKKIYNSGDKMLIEINTSKNMYMTIFQFLPYGGTDYAKVTKIFPNKNKTDNLVTKNLKLNGNVSFPDKINQETVDEYLFFVASEKNIPWLDEYSQFESLKSQISKSNFLMEKKYVGYIVTK